MYKKIVIFVVTVVCLISFIYNGEFVLRTNPDEPYTVKLTTEDYNTKSEYYVTIDEIKNDMLLVSVDGGGKKLIEQGDQVSVNNSFFSGHVELLNLGADSAEFYIDIDRKFYFYLFHISILFIMTGLLFYILYSLLIGIGKLVKWTHNKINNNRVNSRRKRIRLVD